MKYSDLSVFSKLVVVEDRFTRFKRPKNNSYGNVEQELNRKTADLLNQGRISKDQHDSILEENRKWVTLKEKMNISRKKRNL